MANLVSTDRGQEGGNSWTGGKFTSAKFVQSLNTGLAIGQNAGTVLGLDDEGAKVLYGSCDRQASTSHGNHVTWCLRSLGL